MHLLSIRDVLDTWEGVEALQLSVTLTYTLLSSEAALRLRLLCYHGRWQECREGPPSAGGTALHKVPSEMQQDLGGSDAAAPPRAATVTVCDGVAHFPVFAGQRSDTTE